MNFTMTSSEYLFSIIEEHFESVVGMHTIDADGNQNEKENVMNGPVVASM